MSRPDKEADNAGEASMDEILASIRKIIADDPSASRNGPDQRAVNPLFEPSATHLRAADAETGSGPLSGSPSGPLLPPAPRFDDALRATTEAPRFTADAFSPAMIRRRPFVDQALAEMLDETSADAPPPLARGVANAHAPLGLQTSRSDTAQPDNAPAKNDIAEASSSQSPDPWAAWRNLRTSAADGSQPEPVKATAASAAAAVAPVAQPPKEQLSPAATSVDGDARGGAPAESVSNSPSVVPDNAPARTARPSFYPPAAVQPVRRQPATFASAFPRANGSLPPATNGALAVTSTGDPEVKTAAAADQALAKLAAGIAEATSAPTPPVAYQYAKPAGVAPSIANTIAPRAAAQAGPVSSAVAQPALAATTAESPIAMVPASTPTPVPASAASTEPSAAVPTKRSLDDLVSDMLRPMLEKWVEANMPRLMEKALRPSGNDPGKP